MSASIETSVPAGGLEFDPNFHVATEGFPGRTALVTQGIDILDVETADGDRGMKVVFSGLREDGKIATFETGSFLDNGGVEDAPDKHDICISTAGGCTRNCRFCSVPDAELGFERLLTADEIVFQVLYTIAKRNPDNTMPNVVGLMGNGEPPDNLAIIPALKHLVGREDVPIDRVTISTIGENVGNIDKLADTFPDQEDTPIKLQFSLHAADEDKRRLIIPGRVPLPRVMETVDRYAEVTGQPVKFNVVLMEGRKEFEGFTNASEEDARQLAGLLASPSFSSGVSLARRLKLSAFNGVPGKPFTAPSEETRAAFVRMLQEEGVDDIKTFRGSGIEIDEKTGKGGFACGQLRATTATAVRLTTKPAASEAV